MTTMPLTILESILKENNRKRQELEEFYDKLDDPKEVKTNEPKKRRNSKSNIQQKSKASKQKNHL